MNRMQKRIVVVAVAVIVLMLLFPPTHYTYVSREIGISHGFAGYQFILNLNQYVDVSAGLLLVQWVGVILITAPLWVLAKNNASGKEVPDLPTSATKGKKRWLKRIALICLAGFVMLIAFAMNIEIIREYNLISTLQSQTTNLQVRVNELEKKRNDTYKPTAKDSPTEDKIGKWLDEKPDSSNASASKNNNN